MLRCTQEMFSVDRDLRGCPPPTPGHAHARGVIFRLGPMSPYVCFEPNTPLLRASVRRSSSRYVLRFHLVIHFLAKR